ncbi:MAG: prolyl oligopeptidase family serine peptidase [Flavobacteriales bacterium]|nr:prolyl oligopeptidase family serine peptidase [Flavobacteriales bacterium]
MIRTFLPTLLALGAFLLTSACTTENEPVHKHVVSSSEMEEQDEVVTVAQPTLTSDTTVYYDFNQQAIEVLIQFPKNAAFKGTIIALPGWNYPNSDWCEKTTLCEKALSKGYAVILPEMGKSIYCDSVFPETRKDWLKYPTRAWMKEVMIPKLQTEFQLLDPSQNNFVMGLSTGARGAVLLALDLPELFAACGALSGDFDQTRYTKDKLYNGYYGSFAEHTDRWLNNDNAITSIQELTIPVYIGHGEQDQIVPIAYSQQLYEALLNIGNTRSEFHVDSTAGHTYDYWDSEVDAVLDFFER